PGRGSVVARRVLGGVPLGLGGLVVVRVDGRLHALVLRHVSLGLGGLVPGRVRGRLAHAAPRALSRVMVPAHATPGPGPRPEDPATRAGRRGGRRRAGRGSARSGGRARPRRSPPRSPRTGSG